VVTRTVPLGIGKKGLYRDAVGYAMYDCQCTGSASDIPVYRLNKVNSSCWLKRSKKRDELQTLVQGTFLLLVLH